MVLVNIGVKGIGVNKTVKHSKNPLFRCVEYPDIFVFSWNSAARMHFHENSSNKMKINDATVV